MASYQVMCSVTRPPEPTTICEIQQFSSKVQHHLSSVLHDIVLTRRDGGNGSGSGQSSVDGVGGAGSNPQCKGDNLLCALVSKTSVSFSGEDRIPSASKVKMPFFWCNVCPFNTECKATLLTHVVTQHLFVCRFCPYVALSRCDVVQHGLKQHPQSFQQFRDQRLKGCQLKRQAFQQHFEPESAAPHPSGEHGDMEQDGDEGGGEGDMEVKREHHDEGVGYSSGSESSDELVVCFPQQQPPSDRASSARHLSSSTSSLDVQAIRAESVGENVVSSSGMEPDSGVSVTESASTTTVESQSSTTATVCTSQSQEMQSISAAKISSADGSLTDCQAVPAPVSIKKEKNVDLEGFSLALGKSAPRKDSDINEGGRSSTLGSSSSTSAMDTNKPDLVVKQEPVDEWSERQEPGENEHASGQQTSPPLSTIRAENLQRQFEESFGIQGEPGSGLRPVHLYAQSGREGTPPSLVENFLLDPSSQAESRQAAAGDAASSMLRSLLTRPRQAEQLSHEEQTGPAVEEVSVNIDSAVYQNESVATQQTSDNFLLAPIKDEHHGKHKEGSSSKDPDMSSEFPAVKIKDEPLENAGEFSQALIASFAGVGPQGSKPPLMISPSGCQDQSRHSESPASVHSPRISTEKMKSYSNMSLRDILTMNTEGDFVAPPPSQVRLSTKSENAESFEFDNVAMPDAETHAGEVVWECGFCDFSAHDKSIVMSHRQRYHADQMAEAGFANYADEGEEGGGREEEEEDREEEWINQGAEEEEEADKWRDQPSTSSGWMTASQRYLQEYARAQQQQQEQFAQRGHSAGSSSDRGGRPRGARYDEDFEYMSPESLDNSESDVDPVEDLSDKNYEPPKRTTQGGSASSDDEPSRKALPSGRGRKRRGRPPGSKNRTKPVGNLSSNVEGMAKAVYCEQQQQQPKILYHCAYCNHYPATVQELKNHIRHVNLKDSNNEVSSTARHLLMISEAPRADRRRTRAQNDQDSAYFVCPSDSCTDIFPDAPSWEYLTHVTKCQGYVFDAQEASARAVAAAALEKTERVAGFLNCPVNNCYFVTASYQQMDSHLGVHIRHIHTAQGLLFSTVCSALARTFGEIDGFDRFICYRCCTILPTLDDAAHHMRTDHSGQVRGVLRIAQEQDSNTRGIMVSVHCLACRLGVPTLNRWFVHRCLPCKDGGGRIGIGGAGGVKKDDSSSSSSPAYQYKPAVPAFDKWVWRMQYRLNNPINISASPAPAPTATISAAPLAPAGNKSEVTGGGLGGGGGGGGAQLPLIRSILLGQPVDMATTSAGSSTKEKALQQPPGGESKRKVAEEDDVTPVVQCQECQEFVPEEIWKQHACFVKALKSKHNTGSETKKSESVLTPAASSSADQASRHSRLLSALASRHQTDLLTTSTASSASFSTLAGASSKPLGAGSKPLNFSVKPSPTASQSTPVSNSNSSLLSLLTGSRSAPSSQPSDSSKSGVKPAASTPQATNSLFSSTIRSLLTRSVDEDEEPALAASAKPRRKRHKNGSSDQGHQSQGSSSASLKKADFSPQSKDFYLKRELSTRKDSKSGIVGGSVGETPPKRARRSRNANLAKFDEDASAVDLTVPHKDLSAEPKDPTKAPRVSAVPHEDLNLAPRDLADSDDVQHGDSTSVDDQRQTGSAFSSSVTTEEKSGEQFQSVSVRSLLEMSEPRAQTRSAAQSKINNTQSTSAPNKQKKQNINENSSSSATNQPQTRSTQQNNTNNTQPTSAPNKKRQNNNEHPSSNQPAPQSSSTQSSSGPNIWQNNNEHSSASQANQPQNSASQMLHSLAVDVSDSHNAEASRNDSRDSASPSEGTPSQGFLMTFLHQQGDTLRQVLGNVLDDQQDNSSSL